jgi:hypothetical protein
MRAISAAAWVGSAENAIIAQLDIGSAEIEALGGVIERSESQLGPIEGAAFTLDTGKNVLVSRTVGNPVPGFTLIVAGADHSGVLDQFLKEAGFGRERVTIELQL